MIYIDVDGVLADFITGVRDLGFTGNLINRVPGELPRFMSKNYEQIFRNAPPTRYVHFFKHMFAQSSQGQPYCRILTAIGSCYKPEHIDTVKENKYYWLEQHGFDRDRVDIVAEAEDKIAYCRPGDVLYDDKESTIQAWNKAGGFGFLVDNRFI